mgnify:CR=1 FL=1
MNLPGKNLSNTQTTGKGRTPINQSGSGSLARGKRYVLEDSTAQFPGKGLSSTQTKHSPRGNKA